MEKKQILTETTRTKGKNYFLISGKPRCVIVLSETSRILKTKSTSRELLRITLK